MMDLSKLARLHGVALERKCALMLEAIERDAAVSPRLAASGFARTAEIAAYLESSSDASPQAAEAASAYSAASLRDSSDAEALRSLNSFRHALRQASGQSTADWDLVDRAGREESGPTGPADRGRLKGRFIPGLRVFLEDVRSPFNVGSILRTAEAFGFEEVLLSPGCADPRHSRAARSSMGAVDLMPWRRCGLAELPDFGPLIALELGGVRIEDFSFPEKGVLVLGSEELGVSEPVLALAGERRLTITMSGAKASINVGVAFGIAAQAWVASITCPRPLEQTHFP